MSTSDFSPGHRALPRIFANPKESQLAEITQLLFQSGSKWLRDVHGIDTEALPTYLHVYEDGRRVWPKAYPDQLLADFRKHFREEWLPNRAIDYFRGRDSEALQFLP